MGACRGSPPITKLQKRLDAADLVLFEGVGMDNGLLVLAKSRKRPASPTCKPLGPLHGFGLSARSRSLRPSHFRNNGVTPEEQ